MRRKNYQHKRIFKCPFTTNVFLLYLSVSGLCFFTFRFSFPVFHFLTLVFPFLIPVFLLLTPVYQFPSGFSSFDSSLPIFFWFCDSLSFCLFFKMNSHNCDNVLSTVSMCVHKGNVKVILNQMSLQFAL